MKIRAILLLVAACGLLTLSACGDEGNPSEVGNACETDDDCETDNCYLGPGGGYCTTACDSEGSTDQCPDDTVCKPIQGGPARCLLVCGSESACEDTGDCQEDECPNGSSCVDISDTDLRACEPDPQ